VVQRGAGHDGVDRPIERQLLEFDLAEAGPVRRAGIDALRLVAVPGQRGDEAAERAATDLQHGGRGRRQVGSDEGPLGGEPSLVGGHAAHRTV
jgi:hypothetical protein